MAAPSTNPLLSARHRLLRRPGRPLVTFLARATAAAGGGVLLYLGFAPRTLWWLALPAFGLLGATVHGRRARAGFGYGVLFGLGFLLPLLRWTGIYVGPVPWLALSAAEAVFVGVAGAGMATVSRLRGAPVWAAAVWVGAEALRSRIPFGGFPWGRVAFGQPDGPLLPVAAVGGAPLLSFVTVLAGLALGEAGRRLARREVRAAVAPALVALAALATGPLAALLPPAGSPPVRTVTIAAVQGNVPRLGLDFNAQRRAVLDNHVRVTEQLAADVAAGRRPRPDVVLWPENASDIDPLRNPDAAAAIDRAARAVGVPIVLGTVLAGPEDTATNSVLVWAPGGIGMGASSTAPTSGGSSPSASTCRGGRSSGCCPSTPTGRGTSCRAPARGRSTRRASGWGSRSAGRSPSTTWSPTASPPVRRSWRCRATTRPSGAAT